MLADSEISSDELHLSSLSLELIRGSNHADSIYIGWRGRNIIEFDRSSPGSLCGYCSWCSSAIQSVRYCSLVESYSTSVCTEETAR